MIRFVILMIFFFFFKQKTAYELRISDWSSDVCSSDLAVSLLRGVTDHERHENHPPLGRPRDARGLVWGRRYAAPRVPRLPRARGSREIGRASCRERVCQYV